MNSHDIVLAALDVLEAAITASSTEAAVPAIRAELEVLSREDLLSVAIAIAAEATQVITPPSSRPKFEQRLGHRRLGVMVGPL